MSEVFLHGHALLIGVGGNLPETIVDAEALYQLFTRPDRAAYPADQVKLLTAQTTTRQNVIQEFDNFITSVNKDPEATALVFFSGHGGEFERAHKPTEYFLCMHGYDPNQYAETSLSGTEFTDKIQALHSKKVIVILDCCHAGGVPSLKAAGEAFIKSAAPPRLLQVMENGSGRVVIASSRNDENSYGGHPNSVFTAVLLEALSGKAAQAADGYARVLDVLSYLFAQVPQRAAPNPQHPFVNKISELSENFALCYYAGGAKSAPGLPAGAAQPSYSTWARYRLESKRSTLRPEYEMRNQKIAYLGQQFAIRADAAQHFQLEQELLSERRSVAELERQLDEIEGALAQLP